MKLSKLVKKFTLISLAVFSLHQSCFAGNGVFSNVREHGEWITGSFAFDGQKTARLGSKYTQNNVGLFLDFLSPELYLIEVIRTNDIPDRGMEPKYYLTDMTIAVDNKYSISFEAKCAEDDTLHECFVPQSKNDELIRQFKKGNEVSFKIGDFDLYFSLYGFSKAFYRASRLVK
ncbi:MAG: hypothetical protein IJ254_05850 [Succinivibrio sp.]|jgi:hypothetical protein|nr:hypothetical protein [Succinivibrio sp.]